MIWQARKSVYVMYFSDLLKHNAAVHLATNITYHSTNTVQNAKSVGMLRAPQELTAWLD